MCIAIVKPQGTTISDEYLRNCFENNPHGAGIAYAKENVLYLIKGIFDVNKFIKKVREIEKIAEGDILIHCRISTSGNIDEANCHPHSVNDNVALIHNGILNIDVPIGSEASDTRIFIGKYLANLPNDFIKNKAILDIIEDFIGKNNKFAFLNNKGESAICNMYEGVIENGIWYSNSSYSYRSFYDYYGYDENDIKNYISDYIDTLIAEDFEYLGDYPLIDLDSLTLEPFNLSEYRKFNCETLKKYSKKLFNKYLKKLKECTKESNCIGM